MAIDGATPQNVRCKFRCSSVEKFLGGGYVDGKYTTVPQYNYKFSVVSSGSEENLKFFAATPSGSLNFSAMKDNLFEVGKEYYLDMTPAN